MKFIRYMIMAIFLFFPALVLAAPNVSVVLVLDESGSVSEANFQLETKGFQSALNAIPADGSTELSIVGFSSSSTIVLGRTTLTSENFSTINNALATNPKNSGGTNMSGAINTAASILSGSSAPTKVICLATDGAPNSAFRTRSAATNARNSGIFLTPIGIGLNASGRTFLDSIASNPPVANPTTFSEFGTVVTNVCIGVVKSALNIKLTPDPVDFGVQAAAITGVCGDTKKVALHNQSNTSAQIIGIRIEGVDSTQFKLISFEGTPIGNVVFPLALPPLFSTSIEVTLIPSQVPADGQYDGRLVVSALDGNGVAGDFSASLIAPVGVECLNVEIIDAAPTVVKIGRNGSAINKSGDTLSEGDIAIALQNTRLLRSGLVADGNARLILSAKTSKPSGKIRFTIEDFSKTGATLYPLQGGSNGEVSIDVDIDSGEGQASVLLKAGERFPGGTNVPETNFLVSACILETNGSTCSGIVHSFRIKERRVPVVLIHGLWASEKSWTNGEVFTEDKGMKPELERHYFRVETFNYDNWKGPSVTMKSDNPLLFGKILLQCIAENRGGFACTRADLVGHSMGGLVARKFIKDNVHYLSNENFNEGAVRRLITLGTPHRGSGFASLLEGNSVDINLCIDSFVSVEAHIEFLSRFGNRVEGAIKDLAYNSKFLKDLNRSSSALKRKINTFGLIGDFGEDLEYDSDDEIAGCTHADLFNNEHSDNYVSVSSAKGGLPTVATTTLNGVKHVGMGENDAVIKRTIGALNGFLSVFDGTVYAEKIETTEQKYFLIAKNSEKNISSSIVKHIGLGLKDSILEFLGIGVAHAATSPSVNLTVTNTNPAPGGTIIFNTTVTGTDISAIVLTDNSQYQESDDVFPYEWMFNLPSNASGQKTFKVVALIDGIPVESNSVTVTVKPNLSGLQQLTFQPGNTLTLFPGSTSQLILSGLFSDGHKRSLTQAAMETTYSENTVAGLTVTAEDSPVFRVTADGFVLGQQPGDAEVVATNSGRTTTRRIVVVAMKENDADGDGLSNANEDSIGTNKYHPDSDGDGIRDNIEIGSDASNPLDSNGDGIIDALDSQTMAIQDTTGKRVSIITSAGTLFSPYSEKLSEYPDRPTDLSAITMEKGLLNFRVEDLTQGQSIDVALVFEALPSGTNKYINHGSRLPGGGAAEWYEFANFDVSGNRIVLHLTDNQLGDSNPVAGVVSGPGGPGVSKSAGSDGGSGGISTDVVSGGGDDGGCFIATAAYGSYFEPHVLTLRTFRDDVLLGSILGEAFVNFYYKWSPPIANFIADRPLLKGATRIALTPVVYAVKWPKASGGVFIIGFFVIGVVVFKNKQR